MEAALKAIPSNTSVLAQPSVSPHLYHVLYLELPPDYNVGGFTPKGFDSMNIPVFYRKPEYVVFDKQLPDFALLNNTQFNVYNCMGANYTVYSSNDELEIYKLTKT
jgi:hypothetical protein